MTPELEHLAALLESHQLTRLEYEQGDTRVVMERMPALPPGTGGATPGSTPLATPLAAGMPNTATAPAGTSAGTSAGAFASVFAGSAASAQGPQGSGAEAPTLTISAPLVGIAYRAPNPGATPFVECGQQVAEGDMLCLIEAMKLFNEIVAPSAGVVSAILFEDSTLVEHGAPLVTITPFTD
jgi:acetyl-CoA carboxylase biotin carboxyl carrier protein